MSAASRLRESIETAYPRLSAISDSDAAIAPAPGKWSPKEVIGHLIDSASNNHQRFVRAQFKDDLVFDGYAQEDWIRAQRYNEEPWPLLVGLWRHYNLHLAHVMRHAPEAKRAAVRARHNFQQIGFAPVSADEPSTLEHLMLDYIDHLKSHLRQILGEV